MQKYEVLDTIPDNYKIKFIGEGSYGCCYLTSDGDVFKEFKGPFPYEKELLSFTEIEDQEDYFAFPRRVVYLGEQNQPNMKGYRLSYVPGVNFREIDLNTPIGDFIEATRIMEDAIIKLAKKYYIMFYDDLVYTNVIFRPNKRFTFVDMDYDEIVPYEDPDIRAKHNSKVWNRFYLFDLGCFLDAFYSDKINNSFDISISSGKFRSSDVLELIVEDIRHRAGIDVKTLKDYKDNVELVKRRHI